VCQLLRTPRLGFAGISSRRLMGVTGDGLGDQVGRYAGLGGFTLRTSDSPWAAAAVTTDTEAGVALGSGLAPASAHASERAQGAAWPLQSRLGQRNLNQLADGESC